MSTLLGSARSLAYATSLPSGEIAASVVRPESLVRRRKVASGGVDERLERIPNQYMPPAIAMTPVAIAPHISQLRRFSSGIAPVLEPVSSIHFSWVAISLAACQRASGSL